MNQHHRVPTGFTLVEILIAMVILFATISTGMLAYSNALSNSERAKNVIKIYSALPMLQQSIKQQLLQNPELTSGKGQLLGVNFEWHAEPGELTSPPAEIDDVDGSATQRAARYRQHRISLLLRFAETERQIIYQELTWLRRQS
jgi:type II secretory pathway pseudopilin PulG